MQKPRPKRTRPKPAEDSDAAPKAGTYVRLQRVLASAGLGSRRACEGLIQEGRVEINGKIVMELGTKVDMTSSKVHVDGSLLKIKRRRYFAVNKPTGFVTTHRDPSGRPRVIDLVPNGEELFPVGRLDRASEGLILITNDGELAHQLAHPRFGVEKIYRVLVAGSPSPEALEKLRRGVRLAEAWVKASWLKVLGKQHNATILEMALKEGKNREIRRMAAQIGHKVLSLRRIAFGPLRLGTMPPGAARELTSHELQALRLATSPSGKADKSKSIAPATSPIDAGKRTARAAAGKTASRAPGKTLGKPPSKHYGRKPISAGGPAKGRRPTGKPGFGKSGPVKTKTGGPPRGKKPSVRTRRNSGPIEE